MTTTSTSTIEIHELDLDKIRPNAESVTTKVGGTKLVVIGKPGSGKSVLIKALLANKRHLIPIGAVVSGTEDTNHFYKGMFPDLFIHESFKPEIIEAIKKRQKLAKEHLPNAWAVLILDDCMDDTKLFKTKEVVGLMKNSRHWDLMTIIASQYALDLSPAIRAQIDGVFLFRSPQLSDREKLYRNFASCIPSFKLFCNLMDKLTVDFTALYINNIAAAEKWEDNVFYYKAPIVPDFSFGCDEYWKCAEDRCKKQAEITAAAAGRLQSQ